MSYLEDNGTFTFDGVNSADYGVWITGANTYSAPPRRFEEITIPGKNGVLTLDQRAFEDIEHTYPAFIRRNFPSNIEGIRNQLLSRSGKKVLTDSYHPDEFYLAKFMQGVDVEVGSRAIAGRFDLVFKRDPRRFLKSGETPITIGEWGETTEHSGSIATFEAVDSDAVKSLTVAIEPVQSGSGDPSPTNVRPISGHDSVEVVRSGENLYPAKIGRDRFANNVGAKHTTDSDELVITMTASTSSGVYTLMNSDLRKTINGVLVGSAYTYSFDIKSNTSGNVWCGIESNGAKIVAVTTDWQRVTISVSSGKAGSFVVYNRSNAARTVTVRNVQIELGSTATAYEPYQGETYTTDLGGTYYGGTLDVVSGVLTVDRAMIDLGTLTWDRDTTYNQFQVIISIAKAGVAGEKSNFVCGIYKSGDYGYNSTYVNDDFIIWPHVSGTLRVRDSRYTDATTFKTAMSGVQLVYELATPQTIQLTPRQVALLVGTNNVWSDSGDVTVEVGTNPNMIVNPTLFASKPLIRVTGYGTLTVGSDVITIAQNFAYVDIDSEVGDCYHGTDNANASVSFQQNDFPELAPGATGIAYSGHITKVEITPRWWRL